MMKMTPLPAIKLCLAKSLFIEHQSEVRYYGSSKLWKTGNAQRSLELFHGELERKPVHTVEYPERHVRIINSESEIPY